MLDYEIWAKLQERVYRSWIRDRCRSAEVAPDLVFIDEAIRYWRPRLPAAIRAHGGHIEYRL